MDPRSSGVEELKEALENYRGTGAEISRPHFLGLLGEILARRGDRMAAQASVDEAIATARRTGEVYYLPELLRLRVSVVGAGRATAKRRFHRDSPDSTVAGRCLEEAIAAARIQGARPFELRAAIDLARLVKTRRPRRWGRPRDRVMACLRRMPEIEDSPDTKAAANLLGRAFPRALGASPPSTPLRRQARGRR